MNKNSGIVKALTDGVRQLASRPIYVLMMVFVPLLSTFFFVDLMEEGIPEKCPAAVVVDIATNPNGIVPQWWILTTLRCRAM